MTEGLARPRLVYFERWVDPVAEDILGQRDDVELVRLRYADPLPQNREAMAVAHGYQVQPRAELEPPWFGDAALLNQSPRLLALASTGAGYDYIDIDACTEAGVIVCHQGGTNGEAVAEHALGLMLALTKRLMVADRALRRGTLTDRFALQGNDLAGKTLGVIGLGTIGSRLAELCAGLFDMRVLAYDPYVDAATIRTRHATKADLADLLHQSDFVSVHCPRTSETMGMLGGQEFSSMRPSAFFITTARGGIHDEYALADALRAGRLAGAGIDVFLSEPPAADHPLLALDTVIATPHTAGVTAEAVRAMAGGAARQWLTVFSGRLPPRLVNPEAWPRYCDRFERQFGFAPEPL
ncbi:hydroxyacid dehydrogenase [Aeromicrobium sp. CTD01-1L150]|uniref:hydroxyacid dehydrogenase n=1 Tax=Aeromicrobium sp. CTD01-1L150 TaxID=3341830 RepID=UPI0035C00940